MKSVVTIHRFSILLQNEGCHHDRSIEKGTLKTSGRSAHAVHSRMLPTGLRALVVDDDLVAREHAQLVAESIGIQTDICR